MANYLGLYSYQNTQSAIFILLLLKFFELLKNSVIVSKIKLKNPNQTSKKNQVTAYAHVSRGNFKAKTNGEIYF